MDTSKAADTAATVIIGQKVHAGLERAGHLGACLADAGEHDLARISPGLLPAEQLAVRDDVRAGPELGEDGEHAEPKSGGKRRGRRS